MYGSGDAARVASLGDPAAIESVDWDPTWVEVAHDLAAGVQRLQHPPLDGLVEHVGSTAIPGLPAKPVIDLMAPCVSLAHCPASDSMLADAGWEHVAVVLDNRPWRR